ncbi:p-aminobenzoyl-glutamate hydrolase subunit A [Shewanella sp. NFH-SH190041]|uniref:amidohydrolase n=1 Tax=Shewanella sp. NFH-SH190041 TaxID=2950245 RepID=UPI0021C362ED|nr:amidohydrolase [Shewanella sp. NFH-SH190041]BDM63314.1 p-aminobenzoyl-glutamate hydrolase subunit A [Shewanella sp. NFH-SH190041]
MTTELNYFDFMQSQRRALHQNPEIGWTEFQTTAHIIEFLKENNFRVLTGSQAINPEFVRGRDAALAEQAMTRAAAAGVAADTLAQMEGLTGCIGVFDTHKPGPVIALRFDIDCVNVAETQSQSHLPNQAGFRSHNPGLMHACGHDGHTAVGLALAHWINHHHDQLSGVIKLCFQPAEEGVRGAKPMAESGQLNDVDYFLGMHLSFIANSGEIVVDPTHFLCTQKIDIRYQGRSAHAGAQPHLGRNALAAASNAAVQLLGISRHGDGMSRINIGELHAGEGRNVIPAHAELKLEVRGENSAINQYMVDQVMAIAKGCAISFDVQYETEVMGEAVDLNNSPELVALLADVAAHTPGVTHVVDQRIFGGSEDATLLAQKVIEEGGKALFFIVGADRTAGHHQTDFDFDEQQLQTAFDLFSQMILRLQ